MFALLFGAASAAIKSARNGSKGTVNSFGAGYNGAEYDDFMRRSVTGRATVNQFNPRLNINLGFFGNKGSGNVLNPSDAALKIVNARRTGTALAKKDIYHRAASYLSESQLAKGKIYNIAGGDGVQRTLLQVQGMVNGKRGIFEYILEPNGTISHQLFKPGGIINGITN